MRLAHLVKIAVFILLAAAFAALIARPALADNLYGSIRGTVTDPSGGAIPGVAVTATNIATNISRQVTTDASGVYIFLQLPIGDYNVKADKDGFKAFNAQKIHLDLNQVYVEDIKMQVGEMTQEIEVQANAAQVNTTSPQLGTVIDANQIVNMPLIGRDFINLQQFQPGVVGASDRFGTSGPPDYATNGAESQMNVFLIDGTETNDIALNTATFIPSPDALQEFRMVTSTMNPEYARSSGAILSAAVKSGTNSFHGDAFDFYRDKFLNAVNYFQTNPQPFHQHEFGATAGGPVLKNHTFFFFSYQGIRAVAPQTNPLQSPISTPVYAPGQTQGTAAFPGLSSSANTSPFPLTGDNGTVYPAGTPYSTVFSAGTIPQADLNPISKAMLKYVPPANSGTNYIFSATTQEPWDQYMIRIDQTFNSKDSIWGTWFQENAPVQSTIPFVGATLPGFGETDQEHFKFLTLAWDHTLSSNMQNELRGGYNRFNYAAVFPTNPALPSSAGFAIKPQITNGAALPVMGVQGMFTLGFSEDGPQPRIDQVYQAADNFTWARGNHTLKLGFDMRRWEVFNPFSSNNDGQFQFNKIGTYSTGVPGADFLLGIPAYYIQASGAVDNSRARLYYSYAQDQFKIRPNLMLIYGLGWSVDTPMVNQYYKGHGQVSFVPGRQSSIFPNAPLGVVYQGDPGVNTGGPTQWKDVGPRIGFAYSPDAGGRLTGGAGQTSIRGGMGIYYDRSEEEQAGQVVGMPPFAISSTSGPVGIGGNGLNPSFANPFKDVATGATVNNPFPYPGPSSNVQFTASNGFLPIFTFCCAAMSTRTVDPRSYNYDLAVDRQLTASAILTVSYVGSVAHHLSVGFPVNRPNAAGALPYAVGTYGSIDTIYSGGNSNYNSLQVSVDKHLSHRLQFLTSYTYSHSIDQTSGFENSTFGEFGFEGGGFGSLRASNPYCWPKCDYASSVYDARQRLTLSYFYELPGLHGSTLLSRATNGWTLAGLTILQAGFPLDVIDSSDPSGGCLPAVSDFSCWDGPNMVPAGNRGSMIVYYDPRAIQPDGNHHWFNAALFSPVTPGANPTAAANYGNAPRNVLRGPGINNWDFQLYKDTAVTESTRLEMRIELYNVFNHVQFDPNSIVTDVSNPAFGDVFAALPPRRIQLAAKFYF